MSKSKKKKQDAPPPLSYERHDFAKPFVVDLKPRPKALLFFSILLALWVGILLYLYFTTVYPTRHQ